MQCSDKLVLLKFKSSRRANLWQNSQLKVETYHFSIHLTLQDFQSFEYQVEVCEFHYRSGQAFSVDLVEKSSAMEKKEEED